MVTIATFLFFGMLAMVAAQYREDRALYGAGMTLVATAFIFLVIKLNIAVGSWW